MRTKIQRLVDDFENQNPPFDDVQFPEERLLEELPHASMEDRAILVSMFSTFDYNRDANQLVDNIIELHEETAHYFDASKVPDTDNEERLSAQFEKIGFRYPSRDAHAWCKNCRILREKYSGRWTELLLDVGADAPILIERLNSDDFLCLKGVKIAPMYARIINDDVAPLSNVWELDIPVDTHIRRLSKDLFNEPEISDDRIREIWRALGESGDFSRHVVDGALWHIGNKWDDWGEEYWTNL